MAQRAGFDQNNTKTVIVLSNAGDREPVELWANPTTHRLLTDVTLGGTLVTEAFDYIAATYPTTSSEVYTYKLGGSGGTTVAVVTVVYSDAVTKQILTSVTKT